MGFKREPVKVFVSYSHEDAALRDVVGQQLTILENRGLIHVWHDRKILAGEEWADEIEVVLKDAEIILLLISPAYLASKYCGTEQRLALGQQDRGEAIVIPIILRKCLWEDEPFAKLQVLPQGGRALTLWDDRDEACASIAEGIRAAVGLAQQRMEASGASCPEPPAAGSGGRTGALKVLVVDDLEEFGHAACSMIKRLGYGTVGAATTAAEALQLCRAERPDILLMDVGLGVGQPSGLTLAVDLLREMDAQIIICTTQAFSGTVNQALSHGFSVLIKPFTEAELGAALATASKRLRDLRTVRLIEEAKRVLAQLAGITAEEAEQRLIRVGGSGGTPLSDYAKAILLVQPLLVDR